MNGSGPEAAAERNHAGPPFIRIGHRMNGSGPEAAAERNHAGPPFIRIRHRIGVRS